MNVAGSAAVLLGLTVLALASCESSQPPPAPSGDSAIATATPVPCPVVRGEETRGLVAQLTLDGNRTESAQGEPISMALSITNCSDQEVQRAYADGQRYDFIVTDAAGREVWRWSHDLAFIQVIGEETFAAGETVTYTVAWDQTTNDGERVPPGRYDVLGVDVGCEQLGQGCRFGMGLPIEITP